MKVYTTGLAAVVLAWPGAALAGAPLSAADLSAISAGQSPQIVVSSRQNVQALSSGNTVMADTVTSGNVSFSENALSGFSGIGNIVVNTGNNNAIQGTLSVTVVGLQ